MRSMRSMSFVVAAESLVQGVSACWSGRLARPMGVHRDGTRSGTVPRPPMSASREENVRPPRLGLFGSPRAPVWAAILTALLFGGGKLAQAGSFTVNSTADTVDAAPGDGVCADGSGNCTLRAAVGEANALCCGAITITLPAGTYVLNIAGTGEDAAATGDLDISTSLMINGASAATTIVDGAHLDRVFHILPGWGVSISSLTIQNGSAPIEPGSFGGGVFNQGAFLTLTDCTVSANACNGFGGGIASTFGALTLTNCTVSGNTSGAVAGGISSGGPLTLTNCTVSGNSIGNNGVPNPSGILSGSATTLTNCTVSGNWGLNAGSAGIMSNGTVSLINTIVANNTPKNCGGGINSLGYNLSSDATCGFAAAGDLNSTNPLLGPLTNNGGPTETHELLLGSPAIGAGDNLGCPAADQRGMPRPQGATCDIGAFEKECISAPPDMAGWGRNVEGQINIPSGTFTAVAGGFYHSLAIRSDGTPAGWGCGAPYDSGQCNVPGGTFTAVAAGTYHSLAIASDGTLVGWGQNGNGQINVPSGTFTAVSAGNDFGVAIRNDGTLAGWGNNYFGQATVPAGTFTAVSAGFGHSLAIRSDGTLAGWGINNYGQINVPAGTFVAVAAGNSFSLAIRSDGTLVGWGLNSQGQINVPAGTFVAVAAGYFHGLAIRSDGTLAGWGNNAQGQINVSAGTFTAVSAGQFHSLAIGAAEACTCDTDVTQDGDVDVNDIIAVTNCYGGDCSGCFSSCDLNDDGVMDVSDITGIFCGFAGHPPAVCCGAYVGGGGADNDAVLTLVPVGGLSANGGQEVLIEGFMTNASPMSIRYEAGQWDVPSVVAGSISGTMTATYGCADCDVDGSNSSSGGLPYLFGPAGLSPYQPATGITLTMPGVGLPTVVVPAGATRYIGAVYYLVSDCATGDFNINFECTDQPGGVCDNAPEGSNTTRYSEDNPVAPQPGALMSLNFNGTTISVAGDCPPPNCLQCKLYGDVVPATCLIDVDDILCVLNEFAGVSLPPCLGNGDIEPCDTNPVEPIDHGDGDVDSDDILAMLAAFAGFAFCDDPCPPGACTADFGSGMECRDGYYIPGPMSEGACYQASGVYCGDCTLCGDPCDGADACFP